MQLSKRSEYALRALIDLGLAKELGQPLLQTRELAAKAQIPVKFLEQILVQLKMAGYVESRRGQHGGYQLRRPAEGILMGDVLRFLEGPLAPIRCVSRTAYQRCSCPDEEHCGLRLLMEDVRAAIAGILDRFTLADVIGVTLRKLRRDGMPPPFPLSHASAAERVEKRSTRGTSASAPRSRRARKLREES